jgi:ATP-dependent RNA helicase DDX55/SPB4
MAQGAPSFSECSTALSEPTLRAIEALRFTHMTPVQAATIPLFLSHKDVCVQACTGSGKTVAFLVPVFEMLRRRETPLAASQVGAIVIAPTRELARQIFGVCEHFCGFHTEFKAMLLVGGTDVAETLQQLDSSGANILIGTPGRMLDVLKRSDPQYVKELEVLVLDEADTLLDMGFQNTLNEILGLLPKQRRTGLFSATQTGEAKELARAGMRNPVTVKVQVESKAKSLQVTPTNLMNCFMTVPYDQKPSQLVHFLKVLNNSRGRNRSPA